MLTREQNDLLTQTNPGTPGGDLLRRYWQPVALSEELPPNGAPVPVTIFGESLVLFRDDQNRPGLLGIHCSHRAADLSFGRVEDGGLRCPYHGWLYDVQGTCLEQPAEPTGSDFATKIQHLSHPCLEVGNAIFAYMGPGEPPLFPHYAFLSAPPEYRFVTKIHHECNWMQANEGNIDPSHLSYLHRFFRDDVAGQAQLIEKVKGSDRVANSFFGGDGAPGIEVEEMSFGVRIYTIRDTGNGTSYVRTSNFVMPNLAAFPGETQGDGYSVNWHVPITDTSHWKYLFTFVESQPLDRERMAQNYYSQMGERYYLKRNKANRYLQDRDEMKGVSYVGMGPFFHLHDKYATEGEGVIQDRTTERLGSGDRPITAARQMLLQAIRDIRAGKDPANVVRRPEENDMSGIVVTSDVIPADEDPRTYWRRPEADTAQTAAETVPATL